MIAQFFFNLGVFAICFGIGQIIAIAVWNWRRL